MSRLHAFIQACVFTVFITMAVSAFCLGYVWKDGMLDPMETQDALNELFAKVGPWAVAIDIFIVSPLLWWLARSTLFKPKVEVMKGLLLDDMKPIPPIPPAHERPVFLPPPYDPNPDYSIWDEMKQR